MMNWRCFFGHRYIIVRRFEKPQHTTVYARICTRCLQARVDTNGALPRTPKRELEPDDPVQQAREWLESMSGQIIASPFLHWNAP